MENRNQTGAPPVLVEERGRMIGISLNRPHALNSLNHEMIRLIRRAVDYAGENGRIRLVMIRGEGQRGFCAGGDIKAMAGAVRAGALDKALGFLKDEYELDLAVFRLRKPVIVMADGITMGGGLGLSAGADIVLATERTRTAMPETRIGFFPDVGATGWMFQKCPPGYPEFLGLTGYESAGAECVRLGLATHLVGSDRVSRVKKILEVGTPGLSKNRSEASEQIRGMLKPFLLEEIPQKPDMDNWVRTYFEGKDSILGIVEGLKQCTVFSDLCRGVFSSLSERSPTALALTLELLRRNQGRPIEEVYRTDLRAARFMLSHHDFMEGVRARVIDKDDKPRWRPDSLEEVKKLPLRL